MLAANKEMIILEIINQKLNSDEKIQILRFFYCKLFLEVYQQYHII